MQEKEYLTVEETADHLKLNRTTLYKYIRELGIKTHKFKLDRRTYLAQADVARIREAKEKPWTLGVNGNQPLDEAA